MMYIPCFKKKGISVTPIQRTTRFRRYASTTDSGLLSRMTEGDEAAWREFDAKYRDMIRAAGRKRGIPPEDCDDLIQEVMLVCCRRLSSFLYDRSKGHFRSFLTAIVRNIAWQMRRRKRPLPDVPPEYDDSVDREFMREYEKFLLDSMLGRLRERIGSATYSAFEMLCIQQLPVAEVSRITRKSPAALYLIRHRCIRLLRQCITEIPEAADRIHSAGSSSKKA